MYKGMCLWLLWRLTQNPATLLTLTTITSSEKLAPGSTSQIFHWYAKHLRFIWFRPDMIPCWFSRGSQVSKSSRSLRPKHYCRYGLKPLGQAGTVVKTSLPDQLGTTPCNFSEEEKSSRIQTNPILVVRRWRHWNSLLFLAAKESIPYRPHIHM